MAASRWLFTKHQILNTPSRKHGIDQDKELSYRQQAANLIQDMGQRLQVTQLCINTAIVYMHRFYMFQSFKRFPRNDVAPACLFLAAKVEEQPRKLEHVIRVSHTCLHRDSTPPPDPKSEYYLESAHLLVVNENILLQTLGFDVSVDHPHTIVVKTTELVKASKDLAQTSYFLATNSLHLTALCLQYRPSTVACICIHLACKWSNWKIPLSNEGKEWHYYVDRTVTVDLLEEINKEFLEIMDKCPHKLRKKIMGWKAGNREALYEGEGRQSPVNAIRRPTPDSSSTDLRKPPTSSHDPNRPGQSSSQHRFTNHDRKDGAVDPMHSHSDHRAGADKKDEHVVPSERKEGQLERKDHVDKRPGHSAQSHSDRDVNRHDRKEVPPDRKDRHSDRSDMHPHRKESYDRSDRDIQAKDRHAEEKDHPVKKDADEGRFHGKEGYHHGNENKPREDRNLFQTVSNEKLGHAAQYHTPLVAGDLPRKAMSDIALGSVTSSHQPPTSAASTGKPKQDQPLNYREYLQRKERERKEKEKLMSNQSDLNKTFTESSERSKISEGERSKHRPPNLNMNLPSESMAGKTEASSNQQNRSLSGDRNQNSSGRQHNIVIKSPVKPHHNITVKSPIASSELKDFHIDVQKLTIPLTPEKPGSDPFTVNVKRDSSGQELMRSIKQEPAVAPVEPEKPGWVKIKIKSEPIDVPSDKSDAVRSKSKPELTSPVPEKVGRIKVEPTSPPDKIDVVGIKSEHFSMEKTNLMKAKSKSELASSIPEKIGTTKLELTSPPHVSIVGHKSKSEHTSSTQDKLNVVKTKSKSELTSPAPEKIARTKLEQTSCIPEKIDMVGNRSKSDHTNSSQEKINILKTKSKSELTNPIPDKSNLVRTKSKTELIRSPPGKIDSLKIKVEPTSAQVQSEKTEPLKLKIKAEPSEEAKKKPEDDVLDAATLDHLQKMQLKLKHELDMANSPKKTPKVPVLPEKPVTPVASERTTPKVSTDKPVAHTPSEKIHRPDKNAPATHSERKKSIPDIAVPKMPPEKVFPNMPNISVKTNQSLPKVRKIRTEPVLQIIPDEIPARVKELGLPPEDILKQKLKTDPGLPHTVHNKMSTKTDENSKQKTRTEPGTSRDSVDKHSKHSGKHGSNHDSNGPVIKLKSDHSGSEKLKLKIPELNIVPDIERSPSLKISIKTEPGSGHSTPIMSVKSDPGSGANTPIKMLLKRDTSQSGEKSPLKVKFSATGSKPDGEKVYSHGESSSHGHGKHKDKHRKHKHKDRHKERHREHREKREHTHATSELNGDKPGIKISIKIPPQSSSSSELLLHHKHGSKHDKHRRTSISDTALNKNQNASEAERHQPWSVNELGVRSHGDSPARKRRRAPNADQASDLSLQPSQNKASKTESRGHRLRRSSSSHSVVSMEMSDNETGGPSSADIPQPKTENQMEKIKLQLQQAIDQQSRKIQQQLIRQRSGFDLDSYMNASSSSQPPLPCGPPLPPTPPSSQTSIASPPPPPPH